MLYNPPKKASEIPDPNKQMTSHTIVITDNLRAFFNIFIGDVTIPNWHRTLKRRCLDVVWTSIR